MNIKKIFVNNLLVSVFLLILGSVLVGSFFNIKKVDLVENRNLNKFPRIKNSNTKTYLNEVAFYLNDHFGFRKNFIVLNNKMKDFFNKKESKKAIVGKNDWAFYNGCISHYEGKVSEEIIDNFMERINRFKKNFSNIPIYVIVVPNKAFIYEQYLPDHVVKSSQRFKTIEKLKLLKNIFVLDLYTVLKNNDKQTFMRYDTHWNGFGAYVGYKEIIKFLNKKGGYSLNTKRDIKEIKINYKHRGDLANMLSKPSVFFENNNTIIFEKAFARAIKKQKIKSKRRKIPNYINKKGKKRILVFHDSFLQHKLAKLLAETFSEIETIWSFDFKKYQKKIKKIKPELILIEIVDRHIRACK